MTVKQNRLRKIPVPLAVLNANYVFVDFSEKWLSHFNQSETIIGKTLFECMDELPEELLSDIKYCLEGVENRSDIKRVILENGDAIWYEWKIETLKSDKGTVDELILVLENVTDKKFEEALFVKSQQVARIGGWEVDLIDNTIFWSKITKEIHEVNDDYEPNLENAISFYKEGISRETMSVLVQEGIENGKPWDVELQIVTATGREVWVRAIGEPEMLDGKCVRITGTFQDIDIRKKAEIHYRSVSDRLILATNKAGIGIWELDLPNNELLWDSNMYDLYGIKETDFKGVYEAWEACVLPGDLEKSSKEVQEAIDGKKDFNTNFRVKLPNGEIRCIKAEATVIRDIDGSALKMIGINQDISQLKTTQLQLEKIEESLQGAFENSSIGMALVALDGKFISVNQSLCNSLGYKNEELLKLTFQDITHPDDLEIDLSLLGEIIKGKRSTFQIEKRYFNKVGQLVYVLLTVTSVKKLNGEISHFISQIVDISSRIEAEEKLKNILQLTTNQNNSLLNFAHIVSHNLRSHAANLTMMTGFLLDDDLGQEERKNTLSMLIKASNGLNETITHLNEVVQVKLETEKKLSTVPLRKTVDKILDDIIALINENDVLININIPNKLTIKGVLAYLESVILNLVTNAIKYRDLKRKAILTIQATLEGKYVMLSVQDNGMGIDMEKYGQKLFGMYQTFHGNDDARGIGLFITKYQIESMGGKITVESQVGSGTRFIVKLLKA
ncbi:PAS domain-containing sensor histidine kinase [Maribacter cobaltidurans]|uniref:histidine kinase n=1 Tax=Maribacter cobaltidurans TaxID=1178778 RepID=A0A223V9Q6_9FLAO|nr:PAS domain-containing sensor histidine kinase [Maribacter cobaltidurans]ASV31698.1 hypothetical protein CJ263_16580 [Maribacter cobaltidurans]GGD93669.1 hypothetical protein GCM10011412_34620 [Maribacter cobaltidurans]